MKLKITTLIIALLVVTMVKAQDWEFGLFLGPAQYQGDLSKSQVTWKYTRPQGGVIARYNFTPNISFKGQLFFGRVAGNDAAWGSKFTGGSTFKPGSGDVVNDGKDQNQSNYYYRLKRNLNFTSNIFEVSGAVEYNILKFIPGSQKFKWTPYLTTGIGMFHFNPKTEYNGEKITLAKEYTEADKTQRLNDGKKGYSLWSVCVPVGVGVKYNLGSLWSVSFEICGRKTFTDWIDDVHYNWIGPQNTTTPAQYKVNGNVARAQALSDRSGEADNPITGKKFVSINAAYPIKTKDTSKANDNLTARGDSRDKDTYIFTGFTISKTLRKYGCANF